MTEMIQVTHSPLVNFGPYCIAKGGLEMMSRLLSVELGPHKIRVNTVRPGQVYTDMLVNAKAAHGSNEPWEALSARTPFGNGEVPMDEVVNTILFMLSDMAPSVTGQYLAIDGGYQNA
jgi:L-xylulose reductase